jgi:hypothetical protein
MARVSLVGIKRTVRRAGAFVRDWGKDTNDPVSTFYREQRRTRVERPITWNGIRYGENAGRVPRASGKGGRSG